jgi:hypothetical protein
MFYLRMLHEFCTEACIFAARNSSALQFPSGTRRTGKAEVPPFFWRDQAGERGRYSIHRTLFASDAEFSGAGDLGKFLDHLIDCAP